VLQIGEGAGFAGLNILHREEEGFVLFSDPHTKQERSVPICFWTHG
jgi:hypothetical protein